MADILLKYYRDEHTLLLYHLALVEHAYPMHDIHRVRVGIKKIKAVHRMLAASFPGRFDAKALNLPYKRIFRTFGRYREAQLSLTQVKKYGGTKKYRSFYRSFLEPDIKMMKKDINLAVRGCEFRRINSELTAILDEMDPGLELRLMQSFIKAQREKALLLLSGDLSDKNLHTIRILIKNIKPFLKLLSVQKGSPFSVKDFKRLNRTESRIGDWHDRVILAEALYAFTNAQHDNPYIARRTNLIITRLAKCDSESRMASLTSQISACLRSLERSY